MTGKETPAKRQPADNVRPRLDDRFITTIQGKDFVVYAGLLDLAHQKGLQNMTVEAVQYPTKDNGNEAICKATVESKTGELFVEMGDANPRNTNQKIVNHILRMAATRAKARALRDFTNIGMTCLEELGDLDEVIGDERSGNGRPRKADAGKEEPGNGRQQSAPASGNGKPNSSPAPVNGTPKESRRAPRSAGKEELPGDDKREETGPKPSTAQLKAIENLARRRNITQEELEEMVQQQFGTTLSNINSSEASNFIRLLQQSA